MATDWLKHYLQETGYEKYSKSRNYSEVEHLSDPKNEPFKSKYVARNLLEEILSDIKKEKEKYAEDDEDPDLMLKCKAFLHYHIGVNYMQTEERPSGEKHLKECLEIAKNFELSPELVAICISAHNELSILWASREDSSKPYKAELELSHDINSRYRHEVGHAPYTIHDLLLSSSEQATEVQREKSFEKIHTMTLFYLAQACKNLGESHKSAEYCIKTLRRQMKAKEYDPKDWALNAAGISQYYIQENNFAQAKHCLSCASVILEELKEPEMPEGNDEEDLSAEIERLKEIVPQTRADISRCWVKYCIALLEVSRTSLENEVGEMDLNKQQILASVLQRQDVDESKSVERMPLEVTSVEENVSHMLTASFEQARDLFLIGKKHCDIALSFFALDGFVTDHVEVQQDISTLYKHIVFFEPSLEKKCRMHKRRIDLLSATLEELSQQYYLVICQQLMFELAETYSDMLDLKVAIANKTQQRPTEHAVNKMNLLCNSAILYFTQFVNTLRLPSGDLPTRFENNVERAGVIAHFYLARLYSKILTPDDAKALENKQKSLGFYNFVVSYVETNPESKEVVPKEFEICKEMTTLLAASLSMQNRTNR